MWLYTTYWFTETVITWSKIGHFHTDFSHKGPQGTAHPPTLPQTHSLAPRVLPRGTTVAVSVTSLYAHTVHIVYIYNNIWQNKT